MRMHVWLYACSWCAGRTAAADPACACVQAGTCGASSRECSQRYQRLRQEPDRRLLPAVASNRSTGRAGAPPRRACARRMGRAQEVCAVLSEPTLAKYEYERVERSTVLGVPAIRG
ncbi:MAG: hypothetical protein J3K34DRAFT_415760 [Monoraphidium minutum]|nr:MAG: hypothetical protein J3K34DRAFT_415760 [Monoraphidium minutum]